MADNPLFGTRELYDALGVALAADPAWERKGKELDYTMSHVYTAPIDKVFWFRFDKGALNDVTELASPDERPTDFVLTATPGVWESVLVTQEMGAQIAMVTRKIKVQGKMGVLLKNMGAFNHLLGVLTGLDPVMSRDA